MDSVQETPLKRRKLDTGDGSQAKTFDPDNDSGDEIFADYETVETLPIQRKNTQQGSYMTQPTQIISSPIGKHNDQKNSTVQVAGSSPSAPKEKSPLQNRTFRGGLLANAMAPAGTAFRLPPGIAKVPVSTAHNKPTQVADNSSDEDELAKNYRAQSSDEDTQTARRADIKPSSFTSSAANSGSLSISDKFKNTMQNSMYAQSAPASKPIGSTLTGSIFDSRNRNEAQTNSRFEAGRSADILANAYGGSRSQKPAKSLPQTGPAKAVAAQDIDIDDIRDYTVRSKVTRIRNMLPNLTVQVCFNALIKKRGDVDDATEFLLNQEEQPLEIDLTVSDEEKKAAIPSTSQSGPASQKKPAAKQQLKAPKQKLHEKWATQNFQKPIEKSEASPSEDPKPRRRLVQGRKRGSSPVELEPSPGPASLDSDVSDSGLGSEATDSRQETRVLEFFNKCDVAQLVDIAAVTKDLATTLLSQKPFGSLDDVRQVSEPTTAAKGKKRSVKRPFGDKIVDKCLEMWTGYDAIDSLAHHCEELGNSVKNDMKEWGLSLSGSIHGGEIEIADLDTVSNGTRDSGVGTPSSRDVSADEDIDNEGLKPVRSKRSRIFSQPSIMAPGTSLKDYQIVGINWLSLLFNRGLSGILADDMGLGKTCQVIAFLAHLMEKQMINGQHLVIVPASTLENWLREFQHFCPQLSVRLYHGSQNERAEIRDQIETDLNSINVIVTTYQIAKTKDDNKFLRRLKPVCAIYDEGHVLRNSKSAGYEMYMRIPCKFRLLLTGTPLQNNLAELASLLGFILPNIFNEHKDDLEAIFSHKAKTTDAEGSHAALLSAERIDRAKRMMTPFVLRRKKHQVLKHLPKKHRAVQYCEMSDSQTQIYESEKARAMHVIAARAAGEKTGSETSNVMMALRKASIHPLLFRRLYDDKVLSKMSKACLMEQEFCESNPDLVFEDMTVMTDMELHQFCERYPKTMSDFRLQDEQWMDSGKVKALGELLHKYKANGDRVLIFSQFVMVLNILEAVMETLSMQFFRLDGGTRIDERQDMLDQFYKETNITVFLLSTGAGGAGINLACANRVVIFDSSFNPQMDIQAENRAHRVGQTREVEVVRLITQGTIEEQIHALGETKLALDERVAGNGEDDVTSGPAGKNAEKRGEALVAEMMAAEIKGGTKKE